MTLKKLFLPLLLLLCQTLLAQQDAVVQLKEVIITDTQLHNFSGTQSVQQLNDSVINKNAASLTSLLNYNSVIYFKENGLGMVSSPSFRGTTAQQTAVIWNGININSQLNGQTDFNTVTTRDFNSVTVRAGGGSVIYGSSAIGGSIHLDNRVAFGQRFTNELRVNYGSFNTQGYHYSTNIASDKFSASVSVTRNSSDNDYDYANGGTNLNGQYYNTSLNAVVAYKVDEKNRLTFYSYLFDGERHFSLIFPSEVKTKYRDSNTRNMLEWAGLYGKFTSKFKAAFLQEQYKYYQNIESPGFTYGRVESLIAKYDLLFKAGEKFKINTVFDFMQNKGFGSDIINKTRHIGGASILATHNLTDRFMYEAGLRKEVTSNYESPLLYSAGIKYKATGFYTLKLNTSKNFRIPTFNDLYWMDGGNADLMPETSWQAELGNAFTFGNLNFTLTGYYIKLNDMLRWVPTGSVWRPMNTDKVTTSGAELLVAYKKAFGRHNFEVNGTYGYTDSKDETTNKQLIYVPHHKATGGVSYGFNKFSAYAQLLYNGEVFTRSDNDSRYNIESYTTANAGVAYNFGKTNTYTLGAQVLNFANKDYVSVDSRPLPGRNYNMYLTIKF
ncbi:TonB-dependent receptor plug domain-containing protein [Flavobacterium subsaxonicum]|uniref:TonB-dependent receptor n=1 Tax=Flavobacterium subsaxonicum WB 4.1-42 = DSM 21790 TaxID=1121898 RepID=A0A0A2MNM7_9FLAO|nr:TonB-dependent receptor [Flavobacterium subsaxonicum]KGO93068.1 TonB-dependent receptor [Flavobacterium subsaxonicum WB 4.1-42 = DSM 21790]